MFKEVFSYFIFILLISWGQIKVVQKKQQERVIGKRESEGEWDREGKKLNEMEKKTGREGREQRKEGKRSSYDEENGQKQSRKICRTTGVCH